MNNNQTGWEPGQLVVRKVSEHVQGGVHLSPRQEGLRVQGGSGNEARGPLPPASSVVWVSVCLTVTSGPSEQLLAGGWGSGSLSVSCVGLPAPHLHMEALLAFSQSFSSPLNCMYPERMEKLRPREGSLFLWSDITSSSRRRIWRCLQKPHVCSPPTAGPKGQPRVSGRKGAGFVGECGDALAERLKRKLS